MRWSRQKAPLLAGAFALLLCADPVTSVFHLLTHSHRHAWCEAHQHIVHVDPDGVAVGSSEDESNLALWGSTGPRSYEPDECGVLKVLRGKLAGPVRVSATEVAEKAVRPCIQRSCRSEDILDRAPKHGPPGVS